MILKIDEKAIAVIEEILKRGNDVLVKRSKDGIVIIEQKKTIRYCAD